MAASGLLAGLIEEKTQRVIYTLFKHPQQLYHLNSLAKEAKVPLSSTVRILERFLKHQLVEVQSIGKLRVYHLADNNKTRALREVLHE